MMTSKHDDPVAPLIPLIDPTANVLSHVAAAVKRQDDLRAAEEKYLELEVRRLDDLRQLHEKCAAEISAVHLQAQTDLARAEQDRINALTLAESRRLDALLSTQQAAVALASEKSAAQAATLAQQVVTSSQALQAQVAQIRDGVEGRLSRLEQSRYETGGRDTQRDVQQTEGRQNSQWIIGLVAGSAVGLLALVLSILQSGS